MAKVSAHGNEIGTILTATKAFRFMSDGVILINSGHGWRLHKKLSPIYSPRAEFEKRAAKQIEVLARRPALAAYRKAMHAMAPISKRWKLKQAISMMPGDYDGVWSICCDSYYDNVEASVDEIGELCRLYENAIAESKAVRSAALTE